MSRFPNFRARRGELFYDHDFMETSQRQPGASLEELLAPHSYSQAWSAALCEAARAAHLDSANVLIFLNKDQIEAPRSVCLDGVDLAYVGAFDYPI